MVGANENTAYLAEHWRNLTQNRRRGPHSALFWDRRAEGYSRGVSKERKQNKSDQFFDLIASTGLSLDGAEVLDIGSGPGTLALPLAELGAKVTAIDISEQMLAHLKKRAAEEGLNIERSIHSGWSEIDIDSQGFRGRFDLVVASMTPGIDGPDSFEKMMAASKGVCYYSNFVARRWDPSYYELYRMLFNESYPEGGYGFSLPFMYLYSMGYRPAIKLSKSSWKNEETVENTVETVSGFFSSSKIIDEDMKLRIREYFEKRAENGLVQSTSDSIIGMMVWKKDQLSDI
ncbi:MAG: class I SAM-dependent methyltransferase [Methanothrix sp.]|jgi:SAM-dependent methyltransferase|uniref:class I SAM-dependent methyltransferase n=1 Tax=Methanothrix sp. TaxID=90426 RepID=UPI0025D85CB2|nr:class I SAM-dependent methyltransferase [Methanothrix sp.]MBK7387295.1 class I SAM-dependent methyltransferase [Methanothrix sp.]HPW73423.1 class I SAM-dependent methyltransferase [Methanothrix sp.]